MHGIKQEDGKWLLYKYNLVELAEHSIKLFDTFEEAIKERDKRNAREWA